MSMIPNQCGHGITRQFCAKCKCIDEHAKVAVDPWDREGESPKRKGPFAKFDSNCQWCDAEVTIGDVIGQRDGDWVCEKCVIEYDKRVAKSRAAHPSGGRNNGA
jgi:hypothetical protein